MLAGVGAAFYIGMAAASPIVTYNEDPNNNLFGTLNQRAIAACGNNTTEDKSQACGPTAAVNSFTYLQNRFPGTYDNRLTNGNPAGTANALSAPKYMNCSCDPKTGGTAINNFISGKQTWINEKASGTTTFENQNYFSGAAGAAPPDFGFIATQVMKGQDVELLIGFYQKDADGDYLRMGGHYLTVTGVSFNDVNGNGRFDAGDTPNSIYFVDPWGKDKTTVNGGIRSSSGLTSDTETVEYTKPDPNPDTNDFTATFLVMNDYFTFTSALNGNSDGAWNDGNTQTKIEAAVAESVPEPGTLSLVAVALAGLAAVRRRKNA